MHAQGYINTVNPETRTHEREMNESGTLGMRSRMHIHGTRCASGLDVMGLPTSAPCVDTVPARCQLVPMLMVSGSVLPPSMTIWAPVM